MREKKGFTLIELIGVIAVIAVLALLITPIVTSVIDDSKENLYGNTLKNIELSTKDWFSNEDNIEKLPSNFETCYISLGELKDAGVVDIDIKNSRTGELLDNNLYGVNITKNDKAYSFTAYDNGSHIGSQCTKIVANSLSPVLSVTSTIGYQKSANITISYSNLNNSANNTFEYYVSSSANELKDGSWKTYTNGVSESIGASQNGSFYIYVKRLVNIVDSQLYYSTYGGMMITIGVNTYHRFGPYNFDNGVPSWEFYKKTNTNNFSDNELENLNYAYDDDVVTITFRGIDDNLDSSTLTLDKINILIGNTDVTATVTKSLSSVKNISNGVEYTLTLSNMTLSGDLSIVIAADTLQDKAGNKSVATTIDPQLKVNMCSITDNTIFNYSFRKSSYILYIPCSGTYKIELAGAKGGGTLGGAGAKVSGEIYLPRKTKLFITVGSAGKNNGIAGFNGGGGVINTDSDNIGGGGGATDIRINNQDYSNRIIVAAGGGGGGNKAGGIGSGVTGFSADSTSLETCSACLSAIEGVSDEESNCSKYTEGNYSVSDPKECVARVASGGSQLAGGNYSSTVQFTDHVGLWTGFNGSLGYGGKGNAGGGGGGGYYGGGGGSAANSNSLGGAGGSSYISGASGYATHSSGYVFTNAVDTGTNTSDGYAKITFLHS